MSNASDAQRVIFYYQTQYDSSLPATTAYGAYVSVLPLIGLITHLFVAAFHINFNSTEKIHLNDYDPDNAYYAQMWGEISILKQNGIKVVGMLGGAAQGTYYCLDAENFDDYYPALASYITKYQLDGMDLDVEETVALSDIVHLIEQLKSDFGPDFLITLAPVASALEEGGNISGFDYITLENTTGSLIDWYNGQFYSGFGTIFPDNQYIDIVNYPGGPNADRLVATTLTNPDSGYGYVEPTDLVSSVNNLVQIYGDSFGGVAGWEYFNSLPSYGQPWQWAELMDTALTGPTTVAQSVKGSGR